MSKVKKMTLMEAAKTKHTGWIKAPIGSYFHFVNGMKHNEKGPSFIYSDLRIIWFYQNNKKHNLKGPAYIEYDKPGTFNEKTCIFTPHPDAVVDYESYWIYGCKFSKEEWENHPLLIAERQKEILKEKIKCLKEKK